MSKLGRACHREFWTPERRARHAARAREVARDYYANPANMARLDFLQPQDKAAIIKRARLGDPYVQIALDYLISTPHVSKIALAAGIRRCGVAKNMGGRQ